MLAFVAITKHYNNGQSSDQSNYLIGEITQSRKKTIILFS